MNIDLEQILVANSPSDHTLEIAVRMLEDSLPSYRRDLAYALANIRRLEQKYKQTHDEILKQDRALELAKLENNSDQTQIFLGDRLINAQTLSNLKSEYADLTHKAQALKAKISETEQQLHKIQVKRKSLITKSQTAQRRKFYYMALGVMDSSFLVNVIEYPVVQEAILQHSQLSIDVRIKFKPIEVAAFALNRIPSMYVSTLSSYNQQMGLIATQMKLRISDAVKRSIQSLRMGDPLHDSTPLPDEMFCEPAGLLGCLCLTFNRADLRWSEVPKLLLKLKDGRSPLAATISQPPVSGNYVRQSQVSHVQMYLQRSKQRKSNYEDEKSGKNPNNLKIEDRFLELYTLRGRLKYVNVIEKLLVGQALSKMIDIFDHTSNSLEMFVHILNQLTPMYTTSERGLNQLCRQFFENQVQSVDAHFSKSQAQFSIPLTADPLYFQQFNQEYKIAMIEISNILNRKDLTPENLVTVLKQFIISGT